MRTDEERGSPARHRRAEGPGRTGAPRVRAAARPATQRLLVAAAAVAISVVLAADGVGAGARTPLDFNISVNSGAEHAKGGKGGVVPIPLWNTSSRMTAVRYGAPGFPSTEVSDSSFGEKNFFFCGRNTGRSKAVQRIAIRRRARITDLGKLFLKLTVRIGSKTTDGDSGQLIVKYLDRDGKVIGKLATESVEATGGQMLKVKTDGAVPAGTRALKVILRGSGTPGTRCDVYFDNVSVKLTKSLDP